MFHQFSQPKSCVSSNNSCVQQIHGTMPTQSASGMLPSHPSCIIALRQPKPPRSRTWNHVLTGMAMGMLLKGRLTHGCAMGKAHPAYTERSSQQIYL
jgi:hypothetical protein